MSSEDRDEVVDYAGTAVRASLLGCTLGFSACLAVTRFSHRPELPLYIACLSLFHIMEFWTTAAYNPRNTSNKSFLLSSNGAAYWAAQLAGVVEYLIEAYLQVPWHRSVSLYRWTFTVGLILVISGQVIRSTAMIHAAQSFSHALAYAKKEDHVLVTDGIYAYAGKPSKAQESRSDLY